MEAAAVVEAFDVVEEQETSLLLGGEQGLVEALGFESGKKAFHQSVVVAVGFATHAGSGAKALQ